uniref:BPTI/Kunitz inhibitor domain-containing protein n=1 Tax=Glossina austeni TaxID=7395 RepID=A0A1A9V0W6_GLOAU
MKFLNFQFVIIVILISLTANVIAVKDAVCSLPDSADGDGKRACVAYIPSWTYRSATNECIQFIYGGCGGNKNRFHTQEDCENKCKE